MLYMFSAAERGCYRAVNTDVSALLLWLNKVRHKTYLMEFGTVQRQLPSVLQHYPFSGAPFAVLLF